MTQTIEDLFTEGLERYKAGEDAASLIPLFQKVCDGAPKTASSWVCLSWLYLLDGKADKAFKAAQKAVRLSPEDPQAHINLAIAMLETSQKGVRDCVDTARGLLSIMKDLQAEVAANFEDGLRRRPNWKAIERVKHWIQEG